MDCCHHQDFRRARTILSILTILCGFFFYLLYMIHPFTHIVNLFCVFVSYFFLGWNVFYASLKSLLKGDFFNENSLMTVASFGAITLQEYSEAVGIMFFYKVGEFLQNRAVSNSYESIQKLFFNTQPLFNVLNTNEWILKTPQNIQIHDVVLVRKGEIIPLDGVITKGDSYLDTSSLTGESMPFEVSPQTQVRSGMINEGSPIEIRITHTYQDSSMQKVLEMVKMGLEKKSKTEKFITKFAHIYTPIIFGIAFMIFIIPYLLGLNWHLWLEKSIIFLVISCPCALVLSIPLTFFAGIGRLSQQGILLKNAECLENLTKIQYMALDKTGTLTEGKFQLVEIQTVSLSEQEVLYMLAVLESFSSHPIGISIQEIYKEKYQNIVIPEDLYDFKEIPGKGLSARWNTKIICVGSLDFMKEQQISITLENSTNLGANIYLAIDHEIEALFIIADKIKEDTPTAIQQLQKMGLHLLVLSGDHTKTVEHVCKRLNIQSFHANLLPEDKLNLVNSLKQKGLTAFVGDGLNDAPVLSTADISIAMGQDRSSLTTDIADIVVSQDSMGQVVKSIQIASQTVQTAWQNIILSITTKLVILLLAIMGYANIWEGIFSDVGVSFLTIINSFRYKK